VTREVRLVVGCGLHVACCMLLSDFEVLRIMLACSMFRFASLKLHVAGRIWHVTCFCLCEQTGDKLGTDWGQTEDRLITYYGQRENRVQTLWGHTWRMCGQTGDRLGTDRGQTGDSARTLCRHSGDKQDSVGTNWGHLGTER
jgi:hypothetical protein